MVSKKAGRTDRQSGFDQNRVYSVQVLAGDQAPDSPAEIERLFFDFLSGFRLGGEFLYRDRLRSSLLLHHHSLDVDLRDLVMWNEELAQKVQEMPGDMIPLVRICSCQAWELREQTPLRFGTAGYVVVKAWSRTTNREPAARNVG
jgi:hypothetical protein